jgi:hypothetical protein
MHHGCVAGANEGGRERRGGGRHHQVVGGSGGVLHPRAGHRPRAVPVRTRRVPRPVVRRRRHHPRAAGPKHRWLGSRPCSKAATPQHRNSSAVPTAATPSRPSTWCCARPRASPSSMAWVIRPPDEPCWPAITPGWPRRSATWMSTSGPAGATAVSNTCPDRGYWRSALTIGPPGRGMRCCTPIWSSPTGSRGRTDAGRHWTAGMSIGIGWPRTLSTGPPTSASSPGHSGWSGQKRTPTATGSSTGCPRRWCGGSPSAPARSTPSWTGWSRTAGSGHRGWSSGLSRPLASPRNMRHRTPCTTDGERRQPSVA